MISLKQNHTHKNWEAFYTVARNFYLPVNNFPTSHSRIGVFDFTFMGACFSNVTQAKRNCKEREGVKASLCTNELRNGSDLKSKSTIHKVRRLVFNMYHVVIHI